MNKRQVAGVTLLSLVPLGYLTFAILADQVVEAALGVAGAVLIAAVIIGGMRLLAGGDE